MKNKNNQILPGEFEYNMSEQLAKEILATRKKRRKEHASSSFPLQDCK